MRRPLVCCGGAYGLPARCQKNPSLQRKGGKENGALAEAAQAIWDECSSPAGAIFHQPSNALCFVSPQSGLIARRLSDWLLVRWRSPQPPSKSHVLLDR